MHSSSWRILDKLKTAKPPPLPAQDRDRRCNILLEVLPKLSSLQTVSVKQYSDTQWDASQVPFNPVAWATYASKLQEIHLSVSVSAFSKVTPHLISLPSITKLVVYLEPPPPWHNQNYLPSVASFVNQFQGTLKHLDLSSRAGLDLSPVFRDLGHFTQLTTVTMPGRFAQTEETLCFIQRHSCFIKDLPKLDPRITNLATLELQALESLSLVVLSFERVTTNWTAPSPFYSSIGSTLRRLHILGPLLQVEIQDLLHAIAGDGPCALQEFSCDVQSLSVEMVPLIVTAVPTLRSLSIRMHDVKTQGDVIPFITPSDTFPLAWYISSLFDTDPFALRVKDRFDQGMAKPYSLQNITLKRRSCCGDLYLWGLMRLYADFMPCIKSFDRQGNMHIPNPRNTKPDNPKRRCVGAICMYGKDHTGRFGDENPESIQWHRVI
ncbi:hypothetical protein BKA70DRAFT_1119339 [Coprinopsis sp. MPI-PUGE-AT-0042]|nr:hypothetical protein BKA70DRAFT_1119339 [Coprinopsis sp. MPI-PUGE-AT-0042]